MDKACIECWTNSPRKDSIIVLLEQFKDYSTGEIYALTDTNDQLMDENTKLTVKVKRRGRIAIIEGVGLVGIIVLFFGIK